MTSDLLTLLRTGTIVIGARAIFQYVYNEFYEITKKVVWPKPDQPDRLLCLCYNYCLLLYYEGLFWETTLTIDREYACHYGGEDNKERIQ